MRVMPTCVSAQRLINIREQYQSEDPVLVARQKKLTVKVEEKLFEKLGQIPVKQIEDYFAKIVQGDMENPSQSFVYFSWITTWTDKAQCLGLTFIVHKKSDDVVNECEVLLKNVNITGKCKTEDIEYSYLNDHINWVLREYLENTFGEGFIIFQEQINSLKVVLL